MWSLLPMYRRSTNSDEYQRVLINSDELFSTDQMMSINDNDCDEINADADSEA